jgi:hypothetical protein
MHHIASAELAARRGSAKRSSATVCVTTGSRPKAGLGSGIVVVAPTIVARAAVVVAGAPPAPPQAVTTTTITGR